MEESLAQGHKSVRAWLPSYLLVATIWGFSFYLMMIGLEAFTPVGVAFTRIALGAVTLVILSLVTKTPLPPRWAWKYLFIVSLLWVSIPWMLFAFAETRISSALAGIFNGATPLMTLVAILLAFPEEKPTRQRIFGLFLGFVGILVVLGVWDLGAAENGAGIDFVGVGAAILAISCYGFGFPYARRYLTGPTVREPLAPNLFSDRNDALWRCHYRTDRCVHGNNSYCNDGWSITCHGGIGRFRKWNRLRTEFQGCRRIGCNNRKHSHLYNATCCRNSRSSLAQRAHNMESTCWWIYRGPWSCYCPRLTSSQNHDTLKPHTLISGRDPYWN